MRCRNLTLVLTVCLLAACNLQQVAPTPTVDSPPSPAASPTVQPADDLPAPDAPATVQPVQPLPPPPLPTQPLPPTAVPLGTPGDPNGQPTADAAGAASRHPLYARAGRTVGINYEVQVETGTLTLLMQGPEGILWQKTFTANETARAEVTVQQGGDYEILVYVERFDGAYHLSWD